MIRHWIKIGIISSVYAALLLGIISCKEKNCTSQFSPTKELNDAVKQLEPLTNQAIHLQKIPRTIDTKNQIVYCDTLFDWTEGFFPGSCWYLYEYNHEEIWEDRAIEISKLYKKHRFLPYYHDLGFVFNCSYGNQYKLTHDPQSKEYMIDAANSLIKRYNPKVGCIQSWDVDKGWQSKRGWKFPVIIDNMMNLELLYQVSLLTGDNKYSDIATKHAETTLRNHFRKDNSCYHVVDYDPGNGSVRYKQTAQGYAHESAWARGQAWALYGYTMCYRYTHKKEFLELAKKVYVFLKNNPNMPSDGIPYWDFDAPKIPNEPRDVSAAAVIASALIELNQYTHDQDQLNTAKKILTSLSSDSYKAKQGDNHNFILMHSVGSIPHQNEIDVPLNYADYYYLEALVRWKKMKEHQLTLLPTTQNVKG